MSLYAHEEGGHIVAVSDLRGPQPMWWEAPVYEDVESDDGVAWVPTDRTEIAQGQTDDPYLLDDADLASFGWRPASEAEVEDALAAGAEDLRSPTALVAEAFPDEAQRDAVLALVAALTSRR
jgi:hypothetical protein